MNAEGKILLSRLLVNPTAEVVGCFAATMLHENVWKSSEAMSMVALNLAIFSIGSRIKEFNPPSNIGLAGTEAFVAGAVMTMSINIVRMIAFGGESISNLGMFEYAMLLGGVLEVGATVHRLMKKSKYHDQINGKEMTLEQIIAFETALEQAQDDARKKSRKNGSPFFAGRGKQLVVASDQQNGGKLNDRPMARWAKNLQNEYEQMGGVRDSHVGNPDWRYELVFKTANAEKLKIVATRPYQSDEKLVVLEAKDRSGNTVQILVPGDVSNKNIRDIITRISSEALRVNTPEDLLRHLRDTRDVLYHKEI